MDICYQFIREGIQNGAIDLKYVTDYKWDGRRYFNETSTKASLRETYFKLFLNIPFLLKQPLIILHKRPRVQLVIIQSCKIGLEDRTYFCAEIY